MAAAFGYVAGCLLCGWAALTMIRFLEWRLVWMVAAGLRRQATANQARDLAAHELRGWLAAYAQNKLENTGLAPQSGRQRSPFAGSQST